MKREAKRKGRGAWVRTARVAGLCLLVVVSLLVLGGLGLRIQTWVGQSSMFTLRQVEIAGHVTLDPADIRDLSGLEMESHLFELDVRDVGIRIERHPRIRRAVVTRRLPDRLVVRVIERVPVAQVLANEWYEIDETGVVLGRVRPEFQHTLPKFIGLGGDTALVPGAPLEGTVAPRLLGLLAALRRPPMKRLGFERRFSLFLVSEDGSLMIPTDSGSATLLVGRRDWVRRVEKLTIVEPHWEGIPTEPEMIDLRFEGQVVVGPLPKWGKELAHAFTGA